MHDVRVTLMEGREILMKYATLGTIDLEFFTGYINILRDKSYIFHY